MSWLETKIPPPIVALILAGIAWLLQSYWPNVGPNIGLNTTVSWLIIGLGIATGVGLDILAIGHMYIVKTTINPLTPHRAQNLVTTGIYRFTRNPMYVSLALYIASFGLWLDSLGALMLVGVFVVYITYLQIRPEEQALRSLFGQEYVDYCARVRRWL
jgi:protein-S-isoprenylcysteine O-methyltransferase Ste14